MTAPAPMNCASGAGSPHWSKASRSFHQCPSGRSADFRLSWKGHAQANVSKLVMDMTERDRPIPDTELRPINWMRARALMIWGPGESWDNPLMGTRFDPTVRQRRDQARRAARHARHEHRDELREQHRLDRARLSDEHCTPDE